MTEWKKIRSHTTQRLLFWICWAAYFSTYLGRLNYSASLTEMIRAEGFEKGAAGLIGTAFFCAYGLGQLCSGFLGDRKKPQTMVFVGIFGSGICNLLMGCVSDLGQMVVIWCANGLFQSLIWSPIIKLFSNWIPEKNQKRFCIQINTSVPIGTFAAYALSAFLIWKFEWRMAFLFAALCLAVILAVWVWGIRTIQKEAEENGFQEQTAAVYKPEDDGSLSLKRLIVVSGLVFLCVGLVVQGILKDGVTTWIPTYIREIFQMDSAASIISTTLIPILNLGGVYLASAVNRRFFRSEIRTASAFFAVSAAALALLAVFSDDSMALVLFLFGIATTAMMGVNTMLVSVIPIYFAPYGKSSTISGILNSSVYAGGALSTYGIGMLSETVGWNRTIGIWTGLALLGILACLTAGRRWERFLGNQTTASRYQGKDKDHETKNRSFAP